MRKILLLNIGLLFFVSCKKESQPEEQPYDTLKTADWLLGNWEHNSSEGNFSEKWKVLNDTTYLGNSYFVMENDTVFAEEVQLTQKGKELLYTVRIISEATDNLTEFRLTSGSENQLVFENPENDFPKKIVYNRIHKDSIFAEISGGGNPQGFPLKKGGRKL